MSLLELGATEGIEMLLGEVPNKTITTKVNRKIEKVVRILLGNLLESILNFLNPFKCCKIAPHCR